jgi:tRNA threonylcarbamoyladenosine biosynthesis protein TsaB
VLSETTWLAGREHSTRLLVEVEIAVQRIGRDVRHLTGLVVACGPGSFTGVRVAISVAKGMAAGLGIPTFGVSSLDVLALAAAPSSSPVCAVIEAGRGRYATALYLDGTCVQAPRLATAQQLGLSIQEATIVIGELLPTDRADIQTNPNVKLAPVAASVRRGGFLAELGWGMLQRGEAGDPMALDAIYIT